jgi:hypothetical protein
LESNDWEGDGSLVKHNISVENKVNLSYPSNRKKQEKSPEGEGCYDFLDKFTCLKSRSDGIAPLYLFHVLFKVVEIVSILQSEIGIQVIILYVTRFV